VEAQMTRGIQSSTMMVKQVVHSMAGRPHGMFYAQLTPDFLSERDIHPYLSFRPENSNFDIELRTRNMVLPILCNCQER
jgi:hypothetical protein